MGPPDGAVARRRHAQGRLSVLSTLPQAKSDWSALQHARQHDAAARVPFIIAGQRVGSVARAQLSALRQFSAALTIDEHGVQLRCAAAQRSATLDRINQRLRALGLIVGWRDEAYALPDAQGSGSLACIERAAARFWGTLTHGAHANGYVADAAGRPTHLWIARRALDKATDPGLYDNLVGGGVPLGQTPLQTLQREAWEEAGLREWPSLQTGSVLQLQRDVAEGLQFERLHCHDIELRADQVPVNQDGEVAGFDKLPLDAALPLAAGTSMTVDAALVTLDFALRRRLLPADLHAELQRRHAALQVAASLP